MESGHNEAAASGRQPHTSDDVKRAVHAAEVSSHQHLPVHTGGSSTEVFHGHRAGSLLKMLGQKPGDPDADEVQKLHHLVRLLRK